ncbi:MAG: hypothetical protein A2503_15735 [Burkholderiales bacterium RIFOXYD12_FULL_59_19]|nr:MAG: hypothetical protein A2503_15735 [Burkholderiales bacterium RIFOXYD12_FULL_59_19]
MALRHMFDDGQTQAGTAGFTRTAAVHAVKTLRQATQVFSGNTWPGVGHRKDQAIVRAWPNTHDDVPAWRGVAHGVADQIAHRTEQLAGRACQKPVKSTVKDKLMVGLVDLPQHLRQRPCIIFKLAHHGRHGHPCVGPRRGAAFEF